MAADKHKEETRFPILVYHLGAQLQFPIPVLSPDGTQGALPAFEGGRSLIVHNNDKGKAYDGIGVGSPAFSADSRHLAYAAKNRSKWTMVCDSQECDWYDEIWDPVFAPLGEGLAYAAFRRGKWFIVADGNESLTCDGVNDLTFSPDGKRIAYWATEEKHKFVVADGTKGKLFDGIPNKTLKFSPDGNILPITESGETMVHRGR